MADAVTTQKILDGEKNAVFKFTNISDSTGEAAVTKVDVSTLNASKSGDSCTEVVIERVQGSTEGMSVDILWDATADSLAVTTPTDNDFDFDFCAFGGIPNNAGSGKTGDIKFTTNNAASGDRYTIVLHLKKKYD